MQLLLENTCRSVYNTFCCSEDISRFLKTLLGSWSKNNSLACIQVNFVTLYQSGYASNKRIFISTLCKALQLASYIVSGSVHFVKAKFVHLS